MPHKTIKFWYCRTCRKTLERKMFPRYLDANTPCKRCQSGTSDDPATDPAATAVEPATIRPRITQRRHSRDNRNID